jgi:outer membrane protein assembly factor BamB
MTQNFLLPSLLALWALCPAEAQEWTRFRGPNGSGVSHARTIPTHLTDGDINWKVPLAGTGHSSPVLWGDRIFITSTGDKAGGLSVLCLDTTRGKIQWQKDFSLQPFPRHDFNSFASSTPAVDAERVYVLWNEPEHYYLAALDHHGKLIWQRDLGPFVSQHGCGISPIVHAGKVLVGNEQDDPKFVREATRSGVSFVVALDAKTGATAWQTPRRSAVVSYSTPCIYESADGKASAIFHSQGHGIYAVNPDSGAIVWEYPQAFDKRSVSSPIVAGNVIIGSCGSGGGGHYVTAIRAGDFSGKKPELAYEMRKSAPYVPTGIAVNGRVWLWNDAGIVTCLEAASGSIHYQERVGGNFFGSPVWVDGRLFGVSTAGEIVVLAATEQFKVLHRYALNELCHSTPAIAAGRMFIRTERQLVSLGGPKH